MRRQFCQQDGAEQQRERAAPPGHVCASAHGGVSGAQSRFACADCPAGQPCRPADRRASCPADCRVESVHVPPPFLCGSVCTAALFHAGGGIALRGRAFCIPGLNPGGTYSPNEKGTRRGGVPPTLPADLAAVVSGGGACPAGCRLTVPFRKPQGGVLFFSPPYPAFSFLYCPHPPSPRSQSALPLRGRGRFLVFLCKGLRPLHPRGLNGARHWLGERWRCPAGGVPSWSPARPAATVPCGGACRLCRLPTLPLAFASARSPGAGLVEGK